jgi:hypothetical protein
MTVGGLRIKPVQVFWSWVPFNFPDRRFVGVDVRLGASYQHQQSPVSVNCGHCNCCHSQLSQLAQLANA